MLDTPKRMIVFAGLMGLICGASAASAQDPPEGTGSLIQELPEGTGSSVPDPPEGSGSSIQDPPVTPETFTELTDAERLSDIQDQSELLTDLIDTASRLDFQVTYLSPRAAAGSIRDRVASVFEFVQDNIAFEPYDGRVRGARGTLFSQSGNSVDTALLVTALLDEMDIPWRLVQTELDEEQAATLLASVVPRATTSGIDSDRVYEPGLERWRRRMVQTHWWVEAESGGDWEAIDPVFPELSSGDAVVEPTMRYDEGEIPSTLEQMVNIRVMYRRGQRTSEECLTYTADLADLAYRNVILRFEHSGRRTIQPSLETSGEVFEGTTFDSPQAEQVWVELEYGVGSSMYRMSRYLRDTRTSIDLFEGEVQLFSILFLPGWVGTDYHTAVSQSLLGRMGEPIQALVDAATRELESGVSHVVDDSLQESVVSILSSTAGLIGLSFAAASDQIALELARETGVRPYYPRPRIVIVGAFQRGDTFGFQLDLRDDVIEQMPFAGVPEPFSLAFQVMRGRIDSDLAGQTLAELTGLPTVSAVDVLRSASEQNATFVSISPTNVDDVDRLLTNESVLRLLEEDVSGEGSVALVPREAVELPLSDRLAWWRIDSSTGQVGATLDDGIRDVVAGFLVDPQPLDEDDPLRPSELAAAVLDLSTALFSGVINRTQFGWDLSGETCPWLCDLLSISEATCGDASSVRVDRCLSGGQFGDDPLGLDLSCETMVTSFRCGLAMAAELWLGDVSVDLESENFWGPIRSEQNPLDATGCSCSD